MQHDMQHSDLRALAQRVLAGKACNTPCNDDATRRLSSGNNRYAEPVLHVARPRGCNTQQPGSGGTRLPMHRLLIEACHGLEITPADIYSGLGDDDLADITAGRIGLRDLQAFALARLQRQGMERGIVPPGWDKVATCAGCGPVPLWASGTFAGCPWCHVRHKGLPVPQPAEAGIAIITGCEPD